MTEDESWFEELRAEVEHAHHRVPGAYAPDADGWQRVKALAEPVRAKETSEMNMTATFPVKAEPKSSIPVLPLRATHHYANLAATIVVIAAFMIGGWFGISQSRQQPEPRFAALGLQQGDTGTPQASATCDVEPLTVDEVMQIVRNPYVYMANRAESEGTGVEVMQTDSEPDLIEGGLLPDRFQFETADRMQPADTVFAEATGALDRFLGCMPTATFGQIWALLDPM